MPELKDFRDLIGVPFMWGGRDPAVGLDCWGLFMEVQRRFGFAVPDVDIYCADVLTIHRTAQRQIRDYWKRVPAPGPRRGRGHGDGPRTREHHATLRRLFGRTERLAQPAKHGGGA